MIYHSPRQKEKEGILSLKVSIVYSNTGKDGALKTTNVATNNLVRTQLKLYTDTLVELELFYKMGVIPIFQSFSFAASAIALLSVLTSNSFLKSF